jgi:hypothetical protein|nr:hypothetical protein [Pedobacter sp. ASV19]
MKKLTNLVAMALVICTLSSCATVFGGQVTEAQRTKPVPGQPSRAIRPVALIADIILFCPSLIVDFATGAIYKPEAKKTTETPKQTVQTN